MAALWSWPPAVEIFSPPTSDDYLPGSNRQVRQSLVWNKSTGAYIGDSFANISGYGALYLHTRYQAGQNLVHNLPFNGRPIDSPVTTSNSLPIYAGYSNETYDEAWVGAFQSYYWPDAGFSAMAFGTVLLRPPSTDKKRIAAVQLLDYTLWGYDALAAGLTSPYFKMIGGPAGYAMLLQIDATSGSEKLIGVPFTVSTATFGTAVTLLNCPGDVWTLQVPVDMGGGHFHVGGGEYLLNIDISDVSPVVTTLRSPVLNPGAAVGSPVFPQRALRLSGDVVASTWFNSSDSKLRTFRASTSTRTSISTETTTLTVTSYAGSNVESLQLENDPDTGHAALLSLRHRMDYATKYIYIYGDALQLSGTQPPSASLDPATVLASWRSTYPTDFMYSSRAGGSLDGEDGYTLYVIVPAYGGGYPTVNHVKWQCYHTPTTVISGADLDTTSGNGMSVGAETTHYRSIDMDERTYASMGVRIALELGYSAKYRWAVESSSEQTAEVTMGGETYQSMSVVAEQVQFITATFSQNWLNMGTSWMEEFVGIVNADRALISLPPVKYIGYDGLHLNKQDMASIHSQNLADVQIYQHESPLLPLGYQGLWERIDRIPADTGSENLAALAVLYLDDFTTVPYYTAQEAFDQWKSSPPHYANLRRDWGTANDGIYLYMAANLSTTFREYSSLPAVWLTLCNVFAHLEDRMIESSISLYWDNTGGIISKLVEQWSNDSYEHVAVRMTSSYSLRVSSQLELQWGCRTAAQHTAPLTYRTAVLMETPYDSPMPVGAASHTAEYAIKNTISVVQESDLRWGLTVGSLLTTPYTGTVKVTASVQSSYGDLTYVAKQNELTYSVSSSNPLTSSMASSYSMDDYNAQVVGNSAVYVAFAGSSIRIADGVISSGSGDVGYSFEFAVDEVITFQQMYEGDTIVVDFCGENYTFIISKKSIDRSSPSSVTMRVSAVSPAAIEDAPYAQERGYTQENDALASALVDELIEINFIYEIVDWAIPAGRLQATGATPLNIVSELVGAVGGVVDALPDGTLRLRYVYPYAMNALASAPLAHTYTDNFDNLSAKTDGLYRDGANNFRIREGEASFSDSLSWTEDATQVDPLYTTGVLKAYLSPWRDTVSIKHLGGAAYINNFSEGYEDKEEMVEFSGGTGSVGSPIDTILLVEWVTASLGTPTFTPYSTTLNVGTFSNDGYGLAKVSYRTRYISADAGGVPQYVESGEVGPYTAYAYFVLEDSNG